ncbi:hypothetical protein E1091_00295 [Micromonospora fluostatini]|uniref:Uncharacterized protein n=1 Tax=Micromonospora fluostatini TaxID=1629071 RepID=A0ABY2DN15_9ACTN|nr:hypothetical protein E1091_00295 [Micromonospora fluostatini]
MYDLDDLIASLQQMREAIPADEGGKRQVAVLLDASDLLEPDRFQGFADGDALVIDGVETRAQLSPTCLVLRARPDEG